MTHIIRIKKATFYAYHGVLSEEQSVGGKFEADVDIHTDFTEAALNDNLKKLLTIMQFTNLCTGLHLNRSIT
jgi:7,8-dihydroneopterin aldolase/epimerase/oxygenase